MSTTVYVSGGLGNQLHQLSVAVGISKYTSVTISTAFMRQSSRTLDTIGAIDACGLPITSNPCGCESTPAAVRLSSLNPMRPPCCILSYPDSAPWLADSSDSSMLRSAISSLITEAPEEHTEHAVATHFRLGDYLWPRAAIRYGVLSRAYYESVLDKVPVDAPVVAYSDDQSGLRRLVGVSLGGRPVVVAPEAPPVSDFARMTRAKYFVAANSTLSLWVSWYRNDPTTTFAPSRIYRQQPSPDLPGLGTEQPAFRSVPGLILRHPWVLSRRLRWRGRFWL